MNRHCIPTSVEQIDRQWFEAILGRELDSASVLDVVHGTATKVKVELKFAATGTANQFRTVWVKTGLEPHSRSIGTEQVYAGETLFYRQFGGCFETRTPACLFADTDAEGNSAIVLDDLNRHGAQFVDPAKPGAPELIARGLEAIARYHAASWMSPEISGNAWLRAGGSYHAGNVLGWIWDPAHWEDYSHRPRFALLAPELRNRERLEAAHWRLRDVWRLREPWALSHGDSHFGQMYTLPDGEARFLDWQCCQLAHWALDVAYFMVSGLSVEDRRSCARDLLRYYLKALGELGVREVPEEQEAYTAFRGFALHGIGWVMCMVAMQPEHVCVEMTRRFSTAIVELGSVDLVLN